MGDDVRRIEPATEADLEKEYVGRRFRECEKGCCSRDLELRDVVAVVDRSHAQQHVDERFLVDRPRLAIRPGEHDALVKAYEMRRRVSVRAPARCFDEGTQI